VKDQEELDESICFSRSAIEYHEQDKYNKNDPVYLIISAIRDIASDIIESGNVNDIKEVFDKLQKPNEKIFMRLILYLLREYPAKNNRDKIVKYLTLRELFDHKSVHHEYYLLLKQEFKNLSKGNKDKVLKFIEDGSY
jgi:hypothetical protein